jgi:hypothetical protein
VGAKTAMWARATTANVIHRLRRDT